MRGREMVRVHRRRRLARYASDGLGGPGDGCPMQLTRLLFLVSCNLVMSKVALNRRDAMRILPRSLIVS